MVLKSPLHLRSLLFRICARSIASTSMIGTSIIRQRKVTKIDLVNTLSENIHVQLKKMDFPVSGRNFMFASEPVCRDIINAWNIGQKLMMKIMMDAGARKIQPAACCFFWTFIPFFVFFKGNPPFNRSYELVSSMSFDIQFSPEGWISEKKNGESESPTPRFSFYRIIASNSLFAGNYSALSME